jgi:NhaA family Na+:H+ antiporter
MKSTAAFGRSSLPPVLRLQEFLRLEAAGGLTLMATSVFAMSVANSPLQPVYSAVLDLTLEVRLGSFGIAKPLLLWINDGLMAIFFLLVGLELKREVIEGHLSDVRQASLPALAAIGGMLVPAGVYALFNWGDPIAMKGWAVASATDIAFALGILSLLWDRVPSPLKALLLSVAVFDDLGAIVIIAVFYTAELSGAALGVAGLALFGLAVLNRAGVRRLPAYALIGLVLWVALLKSGVHATLAGVALALFIPLRPSTGSNGEEQSPLGYLEHKLHPWVAFGILPVFAFVNAGVPVLGLSLADVLRPVPLGIAMGLVAGKLVGVTAVSFLGVRAGLTSLPQDVGWTDIMGVALLCGVGFTMSLFIASLAFEQGGTAYPGVERLGILGGSAISGVLGYLVLRSSLGRRARH